MEFEKKLSQLEEVVKKLEDKNVSLEDGITLFERGLSLTKECLKSLNESKARVAVIREEKGKLTENPFEE